MRCPSCGSINDNPPGDKAQNWHCSSCGEQLKKAPTGIPQLAIIALIVVGFLVWGGNELYRLSRQTGMQWDTEMNGPWARHEQEGVELYRIHIVNQNQEELNQDERLFRQGDKLVAQFHYRVATAGEYRSRVTLQGPIEVTSKESVLPVAGNYGEFKGLVLPLKIPDDAPAGEYKLRIEIGNTAKPEARALWEASFLLAKTPG